MSAPGKKLMRTWLPNVLFMAAWKRAAPGAPSYVEGLHVRVTVLSLSAAAIKACSAGLGACARAVVQATNRAAAATKSTFFGLMTLSTSTRSSARVAVGVDRDAVIAFRGRARNVAGVEIALNEIQRALVRRTITAAAAGLDADDVAGLEAAVVFLVGRELLAGCAAHDDEAARLCRLAAVDAPRRANRAVEIGAQKARRQNAVCLAKAEPAAEFAGAPG